MAYNRIFTEERHQAVFDSYQNIMQSYEPELRNRLSKQFFYNKVAEKHFISWRTARDIIRKKLKEKSTSNQ